VSNTTEQHTAPVITAEAFALLQQENINQKSEILYLRQELDKLKRMIFGSKSERFESSEHPSQLTLAMNTEVNPAPAPETETISFEREKKGKAGKEIPTRMPLPSHLPRVEEVIDPQEDITNARKIGEEITEILEYAPGRLYVKKIIRPKYIIEQKEKHESVITIGELPSMPIPRGNAGPGLLAHIMISKYLDHLPFYRQLQQFKRQDIEIASSTINDWFNASCRLIQPLYDKLLEEVLKTDYLMADESPIPVLTEDKPGSAHKGYLWVYYSPLHRMVLFDYQKGRSGEYPKKILENYSGTLQTDGYAGYKSLEQSGKITLTACMAHARRKFDQAQDNDPDRAKYVLTLIQKLYDVEREARESNMDADKRKALRLVKSKPLMVEFEKWLHNNLNEVFPKSAIGMAIAYTVTLWPRLMRYLDDGRYEIDNNLIENSIRPVALGRKNYLFAGSHEGAERAAMMYSFIGTCKLNNVEPFAWLEHILRNISGHKANRLTELLPNSLVFPRQK
jgi:transposase